MQSSNETQEVKVEELHRRKPQQPVMLHAPYVCKSNEEALINYNFWVKKGPPPPPKCEPIDTSKLRKPNPPN
jgi:hypothetical protein